MVPDTARMATGNPRSDRKDFDPLEHLLISQKDPVGLLLEAGAS
jgi:hypothetical protein